jgi:hypothetical protein
MANERAPSWVTRTGFPAAFCACLLSGCSTKEDVRLTKIQADSHAEAAQLSREEVLRLSKIAATQRETIRELEERLKAQGSELESWQARTLFRVPMDRPRSTVETKERLALIGETIKVLERNQDIAQREEDFGQVTDIALEITRLEKQELELKELLEIQKGPMREVIREDDEEKNPQRKSFSPKP